MFDLIFKKFLYRTSGLLSELYNMVPANSIERRIVNEFSKLHTNFIVYGYNYQVHLRTIRY